MCFISERAGAPSSFWVTLAEKPGTGASERYAYDETQRQRRIHDLGGGRDVRRHPQTLRLYEREGLLKPSRSEGNTRLYTEDDLKRLEFILSLARDLGVNIAGIGIILDMRERMEQMQHQMQDFVHYVQQEVLAHMTQADADPRRARSSRCAALPSRPAPSNNKEKK